MTIAGLDRFIAGSRRPPVTGDPEALIPEARARQRQRRTRLALAGVVLAGLAGSLFAAFGGGSTQTITASSIARHLGTSVSRSRGLMLELVATRPPTSPLNTRSQPAARSGGAYFVVPSEQRSLYDFTTRSVTASAYERGSRETVLRIFPTHAATVPLGRSEWLTINYARGTWESTTYAQAADAVNTPTAACECGALFNGTVPAARIVYLGTATIDGQPTFHLRLLPPKQARSTSTSSSRVPAQLRKLSSELANRTVDFWIRRSTYLPVREIVMIDHTLAAARTLNWLPRTRVNLAKLVVAVPAGFKQTP